jgi:alcohol dehydrogenase
MHTHAAVITAPGQVHFKRVELPAIGPGEVLARTLVSGISVGTERHYITGAYDRMGEKVDANYPFVTGYQRSAVIEEIGADVEGLAAGDHVIVGRSRLGDSLHGAGGHIGLGVVSADQAFRISPDTDLEEAALWVMAGVGLHGARVTQIERGESVVVLGLGMIGQMAAQAARLRGAGVYGYDRSGHRVDLASKHSADVARSGELEDFIDYIHSIHPQGVDVVVDTGSKVDVWSTCMRLVRREGRINLQGYYPGAFHIDSHSAHVHRVSVIFPSGYDDPTSIAAELERGELQIRPLITHRFAWRDIESAFDVVIRTPQDMVGGVIDWRHD